jgi:transposase
MVDLSAMPLSIRQAFEGLQAENARLQLILKHKDEQIRLLNLHRWGPKAEKLSDAQLLLLPLELSVTASEVEQEAARPQSQKNLPTPQAKAPRASHPGRTELPAHLERREEIIPCCPQDCQCAKCGAPRPVIGYDVREELACRPAEFFVRVIKREKRGAHCQEEQGVAVAPVPAQIVPKSKLSNELIIEALAGKFQQHLPIYRQCAILFEDHGIDLSRQTLNEGILAAADLLRPVVKAQAADLVAGSYLQADETTVPCQNGEKAGKNHKAYIWEYGRPGGPVVFDFQMGRGRDGPKNFLSGFKGKLQSDGYAAYDKLGEGITYVACMAHIRREFFNASKVAPKDPLPVELIAQIGLLYDVEREARSQSLGAEARGQLRQQKSLPLMDALKTRIRDIRQQRSPGSALAKACDYALGQWSRMEEYLKDGQVEIDNNWCEGAMRPIALGRKNWLHVGNAVAGTKVAAIMSIVETCRRLDIPLRSYLNDVLPKLGDWTITRVAELTPSSWKAAQKS